MKRVALFCMCFFMSLSLFALEESRRLYNEALTYFEKAEYGRALKPCEDAIRVHKENIQKQEEMIKTAIKPRQVNKAGDLITEIVKVLEKREEKDYVELINYYLRKKGLEFFDNSITNLQSYLSKIEVYPEAYKLIGDIYKFEGEYDFAEQYYKVALDNSEVLDVPDEKYEILYLLADISKLKNDDDEYEKRLLLILNEDPFFTYKNLSSSMVTYIRRNKSDSMEKFFQLYRAENFYMMNAYVNLAEYYVQKGEMDRALTFASLSVITGITKVINIATKRNVSFEYTNLQDLLQEVSFYDDVIEWGITNNFWKSLNQLADYTKRDGDGVFALSLLEVLSQFTPVEYYRREALLML